MFPSHLVSCMNEAAQTISSREPVNNQFELKLVWQLKAFNKEEGMTYAALKSQKETLTLDSRTLNLYQSTFRENIVSWGKKLSIAISYLCIRKKK